MKRIGKVMGLEGSMQQVVDQVYGVCLGAAAGIIGIAVMNAFYPSLDEYLLSIGLVFFLIGLFLKVRYGAGNVGGRSVLDSVRRMKWR